MPSTQVRVRVGPRAALLAGVVALVVALGHCPPAWAAAPAAASGDDQPAAKNCVAGEEARVRAAGDSGGEDEGGPPKFSAAFYKRLVTLGVSIDGLDGRELPISIEEICGVPKARAKEAAQLAGADGVALLLPRTRVQQGSQLLTGEAAAVALAGADTATLRARLVPRRSWREDEDGNPVATFRAGRIEITD